jgi:hypothetical protein
MFRRKNAREFFDRSRKPTGDIVPTRQLAHRAARNPGGELFYKNLEPATLVAGSVSDILRWTPEISPTVPAIPALS